MKFSKRTSAKVRQAVQNYNAKIRRLQKINPYLSLPELAKTKEIKKTSRNLSQLNRNLERLKRFSERGAEENITLPSGDIISKYELNELKRESSRLQRNLSKRINALAETTPKVKGVIQDFNYAQMGDMRLNNMIVKRDELNKLSRTILKDADISVKEFKNKIKHTRDKQNYQIEIFKNNYLDNMLFSQAYIIGYDQDKIKKIKEEMSKLSNKDFLKAFDEEKLFQQIRDKYRTVKDITGKNYFSYEDELTQIYDEIYDNIESFLKDYPSYQLASA